MYANKRKEELDNIKFQVSILGDGESSITRKNELLIDYNNLMYPHRFKEHEDFVTDSKKKFERFKDLKGSLGGKKIKSADANPTKPITITTDKK